MKSEQTSCQSHGAALGSSPAAAALRGIIMVGLFSVFLLSSAGAEEIRVQATVDRNRVSLNGEIRLDLQINGAQNIPPPDLAVDGFSVEYIGPSTQISVINGQVWSAVTHRYALLPQKEGKRVIGPIAVQVNGKTFQTEPISVEVLSSSSGPAPPAQAPGEEEEPRSDAGEALQLELVVDKTRVTLNQPIPVRLQFLVGGVAVRGIEMPTLKADGFLVKPIEQPTQSKVMVGGELYTLLEFNAVVVPIRTGTLSLGPAGLTCQVAARDSRSSLFDHDPFMEEFFGRVRLIPKRVESRPVAVEVLPFPEEGKPAGFAGAVGEFSLQAEAVPTQAAVGEPVTLRTTVRGEGNLESVTAPVIDGDLSKFKVYEPQQQKAAAGQEGQPPKRVFEQVLIPLDPSVREIPPVRFSAFNPRTGRYEAVTQGPIPITVKPGLVQEKTSVVVDRAGPRGISALLPQPETLGRDIVYIKERLDPLQPAGRTWYRSIGWILFLGLPLVLLAFSQGLYRWTARRWSDPQAWRAGGALKQALSQCRAAGRLKETGKPQEFYAQIFRAVQRYLGDRFNLPAVGLTKVELERHLTPRGIPAELLKDLENFFERCDTARFVPPPDFPRHLGGGAALRADPPEADKSGGGTAPMSVASEQMEATLSAAESIVRRLERWKP